MAPSDPTKTKQDDNNDNAVDDDDDGGGGGGNEGDTDKGPTEPNQTSAARSSSKKKRKRNKKKKSTASLVVPVASLDIVKEPERANAATTPPSAHASVIERIETSLESGIIPSSFPDFSTWLADATRKLLDSLAALGGDETAVIAVLNCLARVSERAKSEPVGGKVDALETVAERMRDCLRAMQLPGAFSALSLECRSHFVQTFSSAVLSLAERGNAVSEGTAIAALDVADIFILDRARRVRADVAGKLAIPVMKILGKLTNSEPLKDRVVGLVEKIASDSELEVLLPALGVLKLAISCGHFKARNKQLVTCLLAMTRFGLSDLSTAVWTVCQSLGDAFAWETFELETLKEANDESRFFDSKATFDAQRNPLCVLKWLFDARHACTSPSGELAVKSVLSVFLQLQANKDLQKTPEAVRAIIELETAFCRLISVNELMDRITDFAIDSKGAKPLRLKLLSNLFERTSLVGFDASKCTSTLNTLNNLLGIPKCFGHDLEAVADKQVWSEVHAFRSVADQAFRLGRLLLSGLSELKLSDPLVYDLLLRIAAFLGDKRQRWRTEENTQSVEDFAAELLKRVSKASTIELCLEKYAKTILEEEIRPFFQETRVDSEGNRAKTSKKPANPDEDIGAIYNEQPWKLSKIECVEILEFVVTKTKYPRLAPIQYLVVPPMLTMIDDYDPVYKERGVRLLQHVVANSVATDLRKTGLTDVFFEALKVCFSYHSHPNVLNAALQASIEFATFAEVEGSKASFQKMESIMEDGILRGLAMATGGKVEVVRILLKNIPALVDKLNMWTIQYLKSILKATTRVLELHRGDYVTQIDCSDAIIAIMANSWIRLANHHGVVLAAVAVAWKDIASDEEREKRHGRKALAKDEEARQALRGKLRLIASVLQGVCKETIQPDVDAVRSVNPELYRGLLGENDGGA
ncbi:hypothetical protein DFJ73DRAFT_964288 [Zopfochytrium polystomum]|nr:hypothetical protein DFJ73DRAFT_964288 [Zopfochytrium polystomum]